MASSTNDFGFLPFSDSNEKKSPKMAESIPNQDEFGFVATPEVQQDSKLKSLFRHLYQPVSGRLNVTPYGIITGLWDILGTGDALAALDEDFSPERIADLKKKFPGAFEEFDKKYPTHEDFKNSYLQGLDSARSTIPTISNLERGIESLTGAPLEAQTKEQRLLKLYGSAFGLRSGSVPTRLQAAAAAPAADIALEKGLGVPESIAEPLSLLFPQITPTISSVSKTTKPSGLPERRFEGLTKERKVTPSQAQSVRSAVENDVRTATSKVIQENSMTARALAEDATFPQKIDNLLGEVEQLAGQLPDDVLTTYDVLGKVRTRAKGRQSSGITSTEGDRAYLKETGRLQKELRKGKHITNSQLLQQYRKNNKELGTFFEPGKSKGANAGKRDALLDYNRSIADIWEQRYPDSEFNKLFKFTNKRYSELADLETIDGFLDKVFTDKKIDYNQGRKFLKDEKIKRSFERTLGEDGYKEVGDIFNDLLSTEKAMKLIKEAESGGFKDILKYAKRWVLSPGGVWAKGTAIKDATNYVRNELLSTPKFRVTWKNAIDDFKAGRFDKAQKGFQELEALEAQATNSRPSSSQ